MKTYYCHECSILLGLVTPNLPESLTGTSYQLEKYIKHTAPTGIYPTNSVFDITDYEDYRDFVVTTTVSGTAQVDDYGRVNLFWVAGREIGATYDNGKFILPDDSVFVVLHDQEQFIHAFPVSSSGFHAATCARCGRPIITP